MCWDVFCQFGQSCLPVSGHVLLRPLPCKRGDVWLFSKIKKKYPYHWFFLGRKKTPFIQKRWLEAPEYNPLSMKMPKKLRFFSKVLTSSPKRTLFSIWRTYRQQKNRPFLSVFFEQWCPLASWVAGPGDMYCRGTPCLCPCLLGVRWLPLDGGSGVTHTITCKTCYYTIHFKISSLALRLKYVIVHSSMGYSEEFHIHISSWAP